MALDRSIEGYVNGHWSILSSHFGKSREGFDDRISMTLTDPKAIRRPWVSEKKVFKLQPKEEIREEICVRWIEAEFNRRTRDPAADLKTK